MLFLCIASFPARDDSSGRDSFVPGFLVILSGEEG
jgi:hypothetical protein